MTGRSEEFRFDDRVRFVLHQDGRIEFPEPFTLSDTRELSELISFVARRRFEFFNPGAGLVERPPKGRPV